MIWLLGKKRQLPNFLKWISCQKCLRFKKSKINPQVPVTELSTADQRRLLYKEEILKESHNQEAKREKETQLTVSISSPEHSENQPLSPKKFASSESKKKPDEILLEELGKSAKQPEFSSSTENYTNNSFTAERRSGSQNSDEEPKNRQEEIEKTSEIYLKYLVLTKLCKELDYQENAPTEQMIIFSECVNKVVGLLLMIINIGIAIYTIIAML